MIYNMCVDILIIGFCCGFHLTGMHPGMCTLTWKTHKHPPFVCRFSIVFPYLFVCFSLILRITQNPGPTQESWPWLDIFLFYTSDSRWTPWGCPEMWDLPQNYRWKLVELPVAAECRRLQSRWGDLWATAACSWRNSHCTHQHLAVDKPKNLWGYIKMWTCNGFLQRMIYLHGGFSTSFREGKCFCWCFAHELRMILVGGVAISVFNLRCLRYVVRNISWL